MTRQETAVRTANHSQAFGIKGQIILQRSKHSPLDKNSESHSHWSHHLHCNTEQFMDKRNLLHQYNFLFSSLNTTTLVLRLSCMLLFFFFSYCEFCCQFYSIQDSESKMRSSQYLHIFYILASNLTDQGQNAVLAEARGSPVVHWIETYREGERKTGKSKHNLKELTNMNTVEL